MIKVVPNPTIFSPFILVSFFSFLKLQGDLVLKDFDIQREAGGISYRAVKKQFRFEVKENYLEIHLFWAGKGTCCIPAQGTYGPLIQAISAIPGKTSKKLGSSDVHSLTLSQFNLLSEKNSKFVLLVHACVV